MKTPHILSTLGLAVLAMAQMQAEAKAPAIPASLDAPAGEKLILKTHASGSQIYTCGAGADGKPQWTLKGPDAELHNRKGAVVGHHSVGPTWKYKDGSEVKAKATAHVDSPDGKSVAWLLLTATEHSGEGLFTRVTSVQRIHTHGGQPPAANECDPAKPSADAHSSYTADYYFYAQSK